MIHVDIEVNGKIHEFYGLRHVTNNDKNGYIWLYFAKKSANYPYEVGYITDGRIVGCSVCNLSSDYVHLDSFKLLH